MVVAVMWVLRCGIENGCDVVNNVEILCCDVVSSCGCDCCSGCDFCCGCENVSARNLGCEDHPPLLGCKLSHPGKHITDHFLTRNKKRPFRRPLEDLPFADLKQNILVFTPPNKF